MLPVINISTKKNIIYPICSMYGRFINIYLNKNIHM